MMLTSRNFLFITKTRIKCFTTHSIFLQLSPTSKYMLLKTYTGLPTLLSCTVCSCVYNWYSVFTRSKHSDPHRPHSRAATPRKVPMSADCSVSNNGRGPKVSLVACGSFNPVTHMHTRLFELARDYLRSRDVEVTAGYLSPVSDGYGKKELVSARHRLAMCEVAVSSSSWIELLSWEAEQSEWSPTVRVLQKYFDILQCSQSGTKLMLLCGADLLESFSIKGLWKEEDIRTIIEDYGIVVVTRPSYDPEKFIQRSELLKALSDKIIVIHQPYVDDLSSTQVRRALQQKQSIKYLTSDAVVDYILKHDLYSQKPENTEEVLAPLRLRAEEDK